MNARVWWLLGAACVVIIVALTRPMPAPDLESTPSPSPSAAPLASLRFAAGSLGRFDGATQGYALLPPDTEVAVDQPLRVGEVDAELRLAGGGVIVAAPGTAFTRLPPTSAAGIVLRVDEGRLWLRLKDGEHVDVSSYRTRTAFSRGVAEVLVYKDRDYFLNTEVRVFTGEAVLRGGDRLRVERLVRSGCQVHVDDTHVFLVSRFELTKTDAWQKRMLSMP